jgi:hypothetical protein
MYLVRIVEKECTYILKKLFLKTVKVLHQIGKNIHHYQYFSKYHFGAIFFGFEL